MKYYFETFGCRANHYDTEVVRALVERAGGELVGAADEADVAVFNSCAVTAEAEVELRKRVRRVARMKPGLRSVVMGCAAARDRGALGQLPGVSHVVPGIDVAAMIPALGVAADVPAVGPTVQTGTRALLRIQDGCDEHCTFCATTLARGANRSRGVHELVAEAVALAERHPEIVLTGIHIGTWGTDIGSSLGLLVTHLVREVPRVRFRLSSVEATEVDDRLTELFAEPERLAPHLHAPLQSGSDTVLRRMGRHWYTARTYAAAVERLAARLPIFALGADVIAGFPGERGEDHAATFQVLADLPFTYLHVFPFSARPGTAAARLGGHLAPSVVRSRAAELRTVGTARASTYRASRSGGAADVVVVRGPEREGLTEDFLTVTVKAPVGRGARLAATLCARGDALEAIPSGATPGSGYAGRHEDAVV